MSVIICIKRRLDDPLSNFSSNNKRPRLHIEEGIFQFLGTKSAVNTTDYSEFVTEPKSSTVISQTDTTFDSAKTVNSTSQPISRSLRITKVRKRSIPFKDDSLPNSTDDVTSHSAKSIRIIDMEDLDSEEIITVNGQPMQRIKCPEANSILSQRNTDSQYVYDYYRGELDEEDELEEGASLNIRLDEDTVDFGAHFGGELLGYRSMERSDSDDSDDSNCEDYYRNDYPDELSRSNNSSNNSNYFPSDQEYDDFVDNFDRNVF